MVKTTGPRELMENSKQTSFLSGLACIRSIITNHNDGKLRQSLLQKGYVSNLIHCGSVDAIHHLKPRPDHPVRIILLDENWKDRKQDKKLLRISRFGGKEFCSKDKES